MSQSSNAADSDPRQDRAGGGRADTEPARPGARRPARLPASGVAGCRRRVEAVVDRDDAAGWVLNVEGEVVDSRVVRLRRGDVLTMNRQGGIRVSAVVKA